MRATFFWNNLHQVCSNQEIGKPIHLKVHGIKSKDWKANSFKSTWDQIKRLESQFIQNYLGSNQKIGKPIHLKVPGIKSKDWKANSFKITWDRIKRLESQFI